MIFKKKPAPLWIFLVAVLVLYCTAVHLWQPEKQDFDYVVFNDKVIEISDVAYTTNVMMVDLEWFCDLIDAETEMKGRTITINWQDMEMNIKLYSQTATLNDEEIRLDNAPIIKDGRIFVHIRTVCDELGSIWRTSSNTFYEQLHTHNFFHIYTPEYYLANYGIDYIIFDDEIIEVSNIAYNIASTVMIDLEWFCDLIDAERNGDGSNISIKWQDKEMNLTLYSQTATLNDTEIHLTKAPVIVNDKVFVPLRATCDALELILGGTNTNSINRDFPDLNERHLLRIYTPEYMIAPKGRIAK